MPAVLAAGGAAGIAMWIPVFPVDTIKSRVQSAPGRPTIGGTIRAVFSSGGVKAFFPDLVLPWLVLFRPTLPLCKSRSLFSDGRIADLITALVWSLPTTS